MRVVMVSHASRATTERPITLASLAAQGFHPEVFESTGTPSSMENRRIAAAALAAGGPVLFFEDDVTTNHRLPGWVAEAASQPDPVTFCLVRPANHPPGIKLRVQHHLPIRRELVEVANLNKWYGTQAIYLPERLVDAINSDPMFFAPHLFKGEVRWTGWDIWLRENVTRLGFTLKVAFPNPVQHRDPPKLVIKPGHETRRPRISITYGHREAPQ